MPERPHKSAAHDEKAALMSPKPGPYEWHKLQIFITDRCNLVCKMCPIITNDPKALNRQTMPREQALHAADVAVSKGFKEIEIAGGEATIVDYFWELLDRVCQADAEVRLVTNGLLTTDEQIQTFCSYDNLQVQISIDGTEQIHEEIRGARGSYRKALHTLERLAEAGCKKMSINTVIQRLNYADMIDVYEALKHLPYLYHAFSLLEPMESPKENIPADKIDAAMDVLKEVKLRAERDGNDVILSDELLTAYHYRMKYPFFTMHPGRGCSVVQRQVVAYWDGVVLPCFHTGWDFDGLGLNMNDRPLDEIIESPEYQGAIEKAIGPKGCTGCSTMCYNWDEEFQQKVMRPSGTHKAKRVLALSKEYLRENHPSAFDFAKRIKTSLSS